MNRGGLAAIGLLGVVLWLFQGAVFGGQVFYKRDIHLIWYPQIEAFVRAVAAGSWPTWDPLSAFGQPLLADPSSEVLYPFTWLNLVMRPWIYYTLFIVTHLSLSGLALYALARRWGLSTLGAFTAAALWMASGPLQSFVDLWHHFAGACWIPAVFLATSVALDRRQVRFALLWGAVIAGQALAGSADMVAMTALAVAAYVALGHVRWRAGFDTGNRQVLSSSAVAVLFAACLSAALWLPTLDLVTRAARRELWSDVRTYWSLDPRALLDFVFPGVATPFLSQPKPEFVRELKEPFLESMYLGLPAVGLVAAAIGSGPRGRTAFLLLLGVVATLVAFGRHGLVYDALVTVAPPLRIFRYPVKVTILTAFSWALLAGIGLEVWRRATATPRRWLIFVVTPLAALAMVAWSGALVLRLRPEGLPLAGWVMQGPSVVPASQVLALISLKLRVSGSLATIALTLALLHLRWGGRSWLGPAVAALALGDLAAYHQYASLAPKDLFTHRPEVLSYLEDLPAPRLYVYDYGDPGPFGRRLGNPYRLARMPRGWSEEQAYALGAQMSLAAASAGRWNIGGSYEPDFRGLHPQPLVRLTLLLKRLEGTPAYSKLLGMGAVTHVLAHHTQGLEGVLPRALLPGLFREPIRVFRVPNPLPRAYVIACTRILDDGPALSRFAQVDWDPRHELILPRGESTSGPPSFSGFARITSEKADRVVVEAELSDVGHLVLADTYDPGWHATVDGHPAQILRGNMVFRAVALPPGRHVVEFEYRPASVAVGAALSAAAVLIGLGTALVTVPRRRQIAAPEPAPDRR